MAVLQVLMFTSKYRFQRLYLSLLLTVFLILGSPEKNYATDSNCRDNSGCTSYAINPNPITPFRNAPQVSIV